MTPVPPLLELKRVTKVYPVPTGFWHPRRYVHALRPTDLTLASGEVLAVVGESGCGKSTLARVIAFVLPPTEGTVLVDGVDPRSLPPPEAARRRLRVQIVHQDPYAALNPRRTVRKTLLDPLLRHGLVPRDAAYNEMARLLNLVGLVPVDTVLDKYPYQLSGGQRQRVVIARALTVRPRLLVADEAVSMIDVSLRASILETLKDLRDRQGLAILFITHDLAQARYFAAGHRMLVMYAGAIVELGPTEAVVSRPHHPYTALLRLSTLSLPRGRERQRLVVSAEGDIPDLTQDGPGCTYSDRCPLAQSICRAEAPRLVPTGDNRLTACHFAGDHVGEQVERRMTFASEYGSLEGSGSEAR
jgi:oligopeptide/dipeptide ABC transporter ATP-binding protein